MALLTPQEFTATLARKGTLLGIDPGRKRVGLALSDISWFIASPYRTVPRLKLAPQLKQLEELIKREEIAGIVVGLPLSMDGHFGPAAQAARDWAKTLSDHLHCLACMWDERLTSQAMERFLITKADLSRKRRKEVIDKMAATAILQSFLDSEVARGSNH